MYIIRFTPPSIPYYYRENSYTSSGLHHPPYFIIQRELIYIIISFTPPSVLYYTERTRIHHQVYTTLHTLLLQRELIYIIIRFTPPSVPYYYRENSYTSSSGLHHPLYLIIQRELIYIIISFTPPQILITQIDQHTSSFIPTINVTNLIRYSRRNYSGARKTLDDDIPGVASSHTSSQTLSLSLSIDPVERNDKMLF